MEWSERKANGRTWKIERNIHGIRWLGQRQRELKNQRTHSITRSQFRQKDERTRIIRSCHVCAMEHTWKNWSRSMFFRVTGLQTKQRRMNYTDQGKRNAFFLKRMTKMQDKEGEEQDVRVCLCVRAQKHAQNTSSSPSLKRVNIIFYISNFECAFACKHHNFSKWNFVLAVRIDCDAHSVQLLLFHTLSTRGTFASKEM